ncbi:BTAD domain-containing putative transcriptional regulator [Streptomyces harbinensis]|uniref:BTAD domain-containing putative transcriptional regulator n=1 Tax=Streptomyces harbinensis TaxID=1176198 RepID=UPI003395E105
MYLRIRLLGPLEVTRGGRPLEIPAGRQRTLLATLALRAGDLVPTDEIAARLWDTPPPATAGTSIRGRIRRLRATLGGDGDAPSPIVAGPAGYRLAPEAVTVDLHAFRKLAARASAADSPATAYRLLDRALALWRGTPLATVPGKALRGETVPVLEEERLAAAHRRFALGLTIGRAAELVPELRAVLADHPLREDFWAQLMRALYRSGRQAEALRAFETCRRALRRGPGTAPGEELRQLHRWVLGHDERLLGTRSRRAGAVPARPVPRGASRNVPRQLPSPVSPFTGRDAVLRAMDRAMDDRAGSIRPLVLCGAAGVGKTALAVHWAHRRGDRYPDGQVYLDLRGYAPGDPLSPGTALAAALAGLGLPPEGIPPGNAARGVLLRALLANRRALLILDNAHSAAQVRPLLPDRGSAALITSRNRLTELTADGTAQRLHLDALTTEQTTDLLRRLIAPVADETPARDLAALSGFCGGLPLAVRVVAEHAARHGGLGPARMLAQLSVRSDAVTAFPVGEARTELPTVLSWSFAALSPGAVDLARHLARSRGPAVGARGIARRLGTSVEAAGRLLDELTEVHLLTRPAPGRYRPGHGLMMTRGRPVPAMPGTPVPGPWETPPS